MGMPGDNWDRVQEVFLAAADLSEAEQSRFLDANCAGDVELRAEVQSLLRADRFTETLTTAIGTEVMAMLESSPLTGQRLGAYRVLRELGRGGMGAVYLAQRDDELYHKHVAIKVVKQGMDTADVLNRFRHERQILADLDHPYIARLIDAGTTPDGRPFFVMEQVEGHPIDVYCREHQLDLGARLGLFLRVCEAVSYAHRGLVVHRDLKPGNIFVTAEGVPKLLDFGIAKLLAQAGEAAYTRTMGDVGPLTPEYSSPEQVRGQPVTTATDVYSLGTILYELLTGTRAQRIPTRTPSEIERVVCQTEVPRPSLAASDPALRKRLRGDLDNIVLMALRKEKERRYPSVDEFAADLERHLHGHPVMARQDSLLYRAGKYLDRNRFILSAAALVFLALLASALIAMSQARQANAARRVAEAQRQAAERERAQAEAARLAEQEQRRVADREKARAEAEALVARLEQQRSARRLTQMVELADRSLYEVHSAIERLSGATEARRRLVASTLHFLQDLAEDDGQDDRLRLVLSAAYGKVADVQGYPLRPNLGDKPAALANYEKSLHLIDPLLARQPNNPQYLLQKLQVINRMTEVLSQTEQALRSLEISRQALPLARKLARLRPQDVESRLQEPVLYGGLVSALTVSDTKQALVWSQKQVDSLEQLARDFSGQDEARIQLADAHGQAAHVLLRLNDLAGSNEHLRRSIALREMLVAAHPSDVVARRGLMISYGNLAAHLGSPFTINVGDNDGARFYYGKAVAIARENAREDPDDHLAQSDLANALSRAATVDPPEAGRAASLQMLREAQAIIEKLLAADPKSFPAVRTLTLVLEYAGHRLRDMGQPVQALIEYRRSLKMSEEFLAINPRDLPLISQALADEYAIAGVLAAAGQGAPALEVARHAVERAGRISIPEYAVEYTASANAHLGFVYETLGQCRDAQQAATLAISGWQRSTRSPNGLHVPERAHAEQLLRQCGSRAGRDALQ